MQEAKTYREYAADCRRMAQRMSAQDKAALLRMADLWESQAQESERRQKANGSG
jgi:phytoene/squalene synthetase